MISLFWKGRNIPDYVMEVKHKSRDSIAGCISYNGFGFIWRWQGKLYLKLLFGKSVVKVEGGRSLTLINKIDYFI